MNVLDAFTSWQQQDRLLRLTTPLGPDQLLVEVFQGVEDLQHGFRFVVTALSTDAHIPLKSLLGQPVLLELLTSHSRTELRPFHGHVTRVEAVGANGGFARYKLTIEPWLSFLQHRVDSTTFQDMTVFDIVESLFNDYKHQGTLTPSWRLDIADLSVYPTRSLTTQYEESDYAFFQRLMLEEGLFFWFEHAGDTNSPAFGQHTLVIADHNDAFQANAQANIRFTQAGTVMKEDSLDTWRHEVHWNASRVELQSWDYRSLSMREVSAEVTWGVAAGLNSPTSLDHSTNPASANPDADASDVWNLPTLVYRDTLGQYAYENIAQGQRLADRILEGLVVQSSQYIGAGTVRTLSPGTTFQLHEHPNFDGQASSNRLLVTRVVHLAHNNLQAELQAQVAQQLGLATVDEADVALGTHHQDRDALSGLGLLRDLNPKLVQRLERDATTDESKEDTSRAHGMKNTVQHALKGALAHWSLSAIQQHLNATADERPLYRNRIDAILHQTPYRNLATDRHGVPYFPKPKVHGQQTAIVVGGEQDVVHTDRDHRIKVQFHWQRGEGSHSRLTHPFPDGHTGAPADASAGTWVRVMTSLAPIAGANWGSHAIPRVGQEVLVEFTEGDMDRPVVIGCLYNGQGVENAQFNQQGQGAGRATGNAPAWFPGDASAHAHPASLSGFKSQALPESGLGTGSYRQLVLDDTPNQSRISLQHHACPHQGTAELNLGVLHHQTDNQRLHPTGYGIEFKTHHSLSVRAGQGLLISTDLKANASHAQLDSREAQSVMEQALQLQTTLANTAQQHRAQLEVHTSAGRHAEPAPEKLNAIAAQAASLKVIQGVSGQAVAGQAASSQGTSSQAATTGNSGGVGSGGLGLATAYTEPHLQLSSPAGIAATTPLNAVLHAGDTSSITANQDINLATQGNQHHTVHQGMSFFTYGKTEPDGAPKSQKPNQETGIKFHAATGKVSLQSQSGPTHINALNNIEVNSITQQVNIAAPQHILLTAMGAGIKIEGGNISVHTPSQISIKAGMVSWTGPGRSSASLKRLPVAPTLPNVHSQQLNVANFIGLHPDTNELFHPIPYTVKDKQGNEVTHGTVNLNGDTQRIFTRNSEKIDLFLGDGDWLVFVDVKHDATHSQADIASNGD